MEKLQAALARAREMREGQDPDATARHGRGAVQSARGKARDARAAQGLAEVWDAIGRADADIGRMQQARVFSGAAGIDAQAFDILRAKTLLEMKRNGWTRIGITSASAGCGKTTIACNIIAGLSRQPEARGILMDFDLRRPSVAKFLGIRSSTSIVDVLTEQLDFSQQAVRIADNAAVSVAPTAVRDPSAIVTLNSVDKVLDDIQTTYRPDIMVFDLPPVLVSDEARTILRSLDAALIVAGAEQSTLAQLDEAEREVAQYTKVAGVVLNKLRFSAKEYGYEY